MSRIIDKYKGNISLIMRFLIKYLYDWIMYQEKENEMASSSNGLEECYMQKIIEKIVGFILYIFFSI